MQLFITIYSDKYVTDIFLNTVFHFSIFLRNFEVQTISPWTLPLYLFLIYTNDIHCTLSNCSSILFADDTTLYKTDSNVKRLIAAVKSDMGILMDWFRANKLSLNLTKKNFILFKPLNHIIEENIEIVVNGTQINQVKFT